MSDDGVVGFRRKDARRVAEATKYVERASRGDTGIGDGNRPPYLPSRLARVTTTITARSGSTAGYGVIIFVSLNKTSKALADITGTSATAYNVTDKTIASGSGKFVKVDWVEGGWMVDVPGSCDFLS